jgi:anti-sigma regulatory factor (Ser/Thr protein kinase)
MEQRLELTLRSDPSEAKKLRNELHAWLLEAGINGSTGFDLATAATEAFINSVEHPVRRATDQITVRGQIQPAGLIVLHVADDGHWRPAPDTGRDHFGYRLMRASVDSVETTNTEHSTTVTLKRHA